MAFPMRHAPEHEYLTLKAKFRLLVKRAGGTRHAAEITRGSESRISEAGAPDKVDRFPAIDQIYDLELDCGSPIVTQAMADLHGYDLVLREAARRVGIHQHFARIVMETRDVELKMAEAMADTRITDAERASILDEIAQAVTALQNAAAEFRGATPREASS